MRGLVRSGAAASAAAVALAALGMVTTACGSDGTGARDEGPGLTNEPESLVKAPSGSDSQRPDPVQLIRSDSKVSRDIRSELQPCVKNQYPIDVSYGNLTDSDTDDVLINVMTCGDAVSIGSYVYRYTDGKYVQAFASEEPPVYSEIDRGDLVVTQQHYGKDDPVAYPSGEDVITYRWRDGHFVEQGKPVHNDYSNAVGNGQSSNQD